MRTIAFGNSKGGVGKSTAAVTLATGLARQGKRVLLVDLDAQQSASTWVFGLDRPLMKGAVDALHAKRVLPEHLHPVDGHPGLMLLPGSNRLAVDEAVFSKRPLAELGLGKALAAVADRFDFVILDLAPEAGFYLLSAMFAAEVLVCPVPCAWLSLIGLRRIQELVAEVEEAGHPLRLLYFLFAVDEREAVSAEVRDLLRKEAGDRLLKAEVRVSTRAKTLAAHRATCWDEDDPDPRGREDYGRLLRELVARLDH